MKNKTNSGVGLFFSQLTGKLSALLLLGLVVISIYVVTTYPLDFGSNQWSNPSIWADNPKAAPPMWLDYLSSKKYSKHIVLTLDTPTETNNSNGTTTVVYQTAFDYLYDDFPKFVSLSIDTLTYWDRPPMIKVILTRPDGLSITLLRHMANGPTEGESQPYTRYVSQPFRVLINEDPSLITELSHFHRVQFDTEFSSRELNHLGVQALFGQPTPAATSKFELLNGTYLITTETTMNNPKDSFGNVKAVFGGSLFGAMGTDSQGRDLAKGLLFGFPVALFIGILASTLTTAIGAGLGIISGYQGGWIDTFIQRTVDIVGNIPLLPILIFMVFIVGSNLPLIILLLVVFSWPGLTILIRTMVLQIRSGQLVEASVALGSSRWRIMSRHIFPQTAPYIIAQMVFFTPAAILAEAGLSFLGLGDPAIPTWGQILEQGFRTGAVYVGYWWWIIPPGVLIVITAMCFVLLALALEPVINPKIRGQKS